MRSIVLLLGAALLCGCTYYMNASNPSQPAAEPPPRPVDQGCMSDCLGAGAERSFCTQRCNK
jgi:hypothetical protein